MDQPLYQGSPRQLAMWRRGADTVTFLVVGLVVGVVLLVLGTALVVALLLRARRLQQEAQQTTVRKGPPGWNSTDPAVRAPSVSAPSTSSRRPSITTLTTDGMLLELNRSFPGSPRPSASRHSTCSNTCDSPRAPAGIRSGRITPEADGARRSRASTASITYPRPSTPGSEGVRCSPRATTGGASSRPASPRTSKGSHQEGFRSTASSPASSKRSTREGPVPSSKRSGAAAGSGNA